MDSGIDRRKRVQRLKKIILCTIGAAIVIPTVISIVLAVRIAMLHREIAQLRVDLDNQGDVEAMSEAAGIYTTASVEQSQRDGQVQELEAFDPDRDKAYAKKIYLTFDDGPSSNTDRILDILNAYGIKATFFVVGKTDESSRKAYQRIVAEGHTLAMHSYSHKYDTMYQSKEGFIEDLTKLQEYLYEVTGIWPRFYRFPGGSSNKVSSTDMQELIHVLNDNDITYFDWNVESGDAISGQLPVADIVQNCTVKIDALDESMILMHDAADRDTTVEALPQVIEQIMERGDAEFLPITDETIPVQHRTESN